VPFYLSELLTRIAPARAVRSTEALSLAVTHFKLITLGDRSFFFSRTWAVNFSSIRAGTLACTGATPGTVLLLQTLS